MAQFIAIEGIDGVGKTTVVNELKKTLIETVFTREPGGTNYAELIRNLMLSDIKDVDQVSWSYAMCSARYDHLNKVILPALMDNKNVICDRYILSTLMYQCSESMQAFDVIKMSLQLEKEWFGKKTFLNKTIILDAPNELIIDRKKKSSELNKYDVLTNRDIDRRRNQMESAKEMYTHILPNSTIYTLNLNENDSVEEIAHRIKQIIKIND